MCLASLMTQLIASAPPSLVHVDDYEGATCMVKYTNVQQVFYSGYINKRSIKVETILMPNNLLMLFVPVSAQRADAGVLTVSSLNIFLLQLQRGCFVMLAEAEVIYSGFGNSAFNLSLQCI
jgi:hypothetical protein